MEHIDKLSEAIQAVCPIVGISSEGRIDFSPEATDIQKATAKKVFQEFNPKDYDYIDQRKKEYPSIEDQLDMLYKDQANGTTTFSDNIGKIKQKFPNPKELDVIADPSPPILVTLNRNPLSVPLQ